MILYTFKSISNRFLISRLIARMVSATRGFPQYFPRSEDRDDGRSRPSSDLCSGSVTAKHVHIELGEIPVHCISSLAALGQLQSVAV